MELHYYVTHSHDGISRVWLHIRGTRPQGDVLVAQCFKQGDANLLRKLLQDHADTAHQPRQFLNVQSAQEVRNDVL